MQNILISKSRKRLISAILSSKQYNQTSDKQLYLQDT